MNLNSIRSSRAAVVILIVTAVMVGCAEKYGHMQLSHEVNEIFKSYQVLPGYRYYYSGPVGRPNAIMGIHNDYTLETTQWTEFEATGIILKKWVSWINFHFDQNVRHYPFGSSILDLAGNQVGIWYSIWDWTPVILKDENRIQVYPPIRHDPLNSPGDDFDKDKKF